MTVLTMRYQRGHFTISGPDIEMRKFCATPCDSATVRQGRAYFRANFPVDHVDILCNSCRKVSDIGVDAVIPVVVATPWSTTNRRSATKRIEGILSRSSLRYYQWVVARLPSSSPAIGGTAAGAGVGGSQAIQPAPIARMRTTAPKPRHVADGAGRPSLTSDMCCKPLLRSPPWQPRATSAGP
jgi:hypothetical protein